MTITGAPPVVPLPDEKSIDEALAYYDRFLGFRQKFQRVPGVQAAVSVRGSVRLSVAYGQADVEAGIPLTTSHLFRIASHSKTFTATTVMQLLESEQLRLDDPAERWVDYLAGTAVGSVTLRQLLSHSAGIIRDGIDGDFWQLGRPFPDRAELREILLDSSTPVLGLDVTFKYSNIGYSLLALVIESVTGVDYNDRVRSHIIEPLGLHDLGAELDPARAMEYANGYSSLSYADTRVPIEHVDTRAMSGATGFYGTAADLVQYFSAHFLGDPALLTDVSKRAMQHPWWSVPGSDRHYGLGLAIAKVGDRQLIGHGGGYPGHITSSVADTGAGLAISVLTNAIDGPAEVLAHAGVTLIDLAGRKPRPPSAGDGGPGSIDPARFAGRFASLWGVIDIAVLGGRLFRIHPGAADLLEDAAELEIIDGTSLRIADGSGYGAVGELISYEFADDGTVTAVRGESGMSLLPIDRFSLPDRVVLERVVLDRVALSE